MKPLILFSIPLLIAGCGEKEMSTKTVHFTDGSSADQPLSLAQLKQEQENYHHYTISITADGSIFIDGKRKVTEEELAILFSAKTEKPKSALLQIDQEAKAIQVIKITDILVDSGAVKIDFSSEVTKE